MLLLIDNFDSFTFNLVQAIEVLGVEVKVIRNSCQSVDECLALNPQYLLVGPGPKDPESAGISNQIIQRLAGKIPILGVCLGHQCIGKIYGGNIVRSTLGPMHGKTSSIIHQNTGVFKGLSQGFSATRYHSLVVDNTSLPDCLEVTAETLDGEIMGLKHRKYPIEGVQFHPESVLTKEGTKLLKNFLSD